MNKPHLSKAQLRILGKTVPVPSDYPDGTLLWDLTTLYSYCKECKQRVHLGTYKQGYRTDLRKYRYLIDGVIHVHKQRCN